MTLLQAGPIARQISGSDPERRFLLSVLAKRTYRLDSQGGCTRSEGELPLAAEFQADGELLAHDSDLYAFKIASDVVVKGNSYGADATVQIGWSAKSIRVIGNRRCTLSSTGGILFSEPERFDRIPLRYDRAYGGKDVAAEAKRGNPYESFRKYFDKGIDVAKASPFLYPRNPAGVGYLIEPTREAVEQSRLPNLEDPVDLLTPDRIVVGKVGRWARMPLPQAFDWVDYGWFPRLAYLGFWPEFEPFDGPIAEVARGFAPEDLVKPAPLALKLSYRVANGASLGLQLPYLRGDEECRLINIHPKIADFRFRLPGERPKIWTDGRNGTFNPTEPVIHTVVIEPEEERLSVVWRGSAPALRPYLPQELETMPFRVEW